MKKKKIDFYIEQHRSWGIGNFIHLTPAIQLLYSKFKQPIPVLFQTTTVKQMFKKWDKIQVIKNRKGKKILSSRTDKKLQNKLKNLKISECEYKTNTIKKQFKIKKETPFTYVPSYKSPLSDVIDYFVIINGCAGKKWKEKKKIPIRTMINIIQTIYKKYQIVFIGSDKEKDEINKMNKSIQRKGKIYLNNIQDTIGLINNCTAMITNDTGCYHIACALQIENIFCMWKDTDFQRNKSSYENVKYSFKNKWIEDFNKWFKKF